MSDFQSMRTNISHRRYLINRPCGGLIYHNCDMETFAHRVRQSRKAAGLTQRELALKTGLSQTTISDIERGRNETSADIVALARALRVLAEWLADGKGPRALDAAPQSISNSSPHAREPTDSTSLHSDSAIQDAVEKQEAELLEQIEELMTLWRRVTPTDRTWVILQLRQRAKKLELHHSRNVAENTGEDVTSSDNPSWHRTADTPLDLWEMLQDEKKKTLGGKPRAAK